jgi:hypothetical protein
MLGIPDEYTAWCVDEAMAEFGALQAKGKKIKPKDTKDNTALLIEAGILKE